MKHRTIADALAPACFASMAQLSTASGRLRCLLYAVPLALLLAACGEKSGDSNIRQTEFPGQITAGGASSGEVMQRSKGQVTASMPAGTPGIPEGSGGTVGGAALGASVKSQADGRERASDAPPTGSVGAPAASAPEAVQRSGRGSTAPEPGTASGTPRPTVADSPTSGDERKRTDKETGK